jgi:hypothetical protein
MAFFDSSLLRNSFLAVHGCTAEKPVKSYAEKFGKFSKQKATKAAKTRFGDPPEERSLFSLLSSVSATADSAMSRIGSDQAEISKQKITPKAFASRQRKQRVCSAQAEALSYLCYFLYQKVCVGKPLKPNALEAYSS